MGQQLLGRPTSQMFDPTFQSAGFPTLTGASSATAPNQQQYLGYTTPAQQPQAIATIPRQIVPRTLGMATNMPRWGTAGFRGISNPIRRVSM